MSDDPRFEEFLRREARGYHRPGAEVPSDDIWNRIEGDVARAIGARGAAGRVTWRTWLAIGTAAAAMLVIGVAIGRLSAPSGARTDRTVAAAAPDTALAGIRERVMRAALEEHLSRTEIFLTAVRADLRAEREDPERAERSRELLARTRLLIDAPAPAGGAAERALLKDIELVLAAVAALPSHAERSELDRRLLEETLRQSGVLSRLRTAVPTTPATS